MTVTLQLQPEVEAGLLTRADANGMSPEEYLLSVVEQAAAALNHEHSSDVKLAREEAVRRMLEFSEGHHLSLAEHVTRKFLHESHRF